MKLEEKEKELKVKEEEGRMINYHKFTEINQVVLALFYYNHTQPISSTSSQLFVSVGRWSSFPTRERNERRIREKEEERVSKRISEKEMKRKRREKWKVAVLGSYTKEVNHHQNNYSFNFFPNTRTVAEEHLTSAPFQVPLFDAPLSE